MYKITDPIIERKAREAFPRWKGSLSDVEDFEWCKRLPLLGGGALETFRVKIGEVTKHIEVIMP